ncbi:MAG: aminotransferase class I/II-fold pyridoxal phosphate-dependent enzyme [Anaerolineaceae bacterium]
MNLPPFKLERFYAKYEFSARYMLSSSDCESLTMASLLEMASPETRALWDGLSLGYTESSGHPLLREAIADLYDFIRPPDVLTAAPEEAIFIAMQGLLQPGDHVIFTAPTYQSLYDVAAAIGCRVSPWALAARSSVWSLDLERLESLITPATRLLVINFPNNPTGFLPSPADFDAMLKIAARHRLYVFSDEMYRLLETHPSSRLPAACDVYPLAISLAGLSKTCGLPGLRAGWLACRQPNLVEKFQAVKDYTTICGSAPSEILALIALQNMDTLLERSLGFIRANTVLAREFFQRSEKLFEWYPPLGGSVAFPRWMGSLPIEVLCDQLVHTRGVMLVPGYLFDHTGSYFRLGLGRANFPEALALFEEFLVKEKVK